MSIATSRVRSSLFFNSLSCRIFLCLFPTTSCWINRSSDSALSLRLHFEAWIRQRCRKTLIWFSFFCFSCYSWFLANTWFTLAPTCLSNHAQICSGLMLFSVSFHFQSLLRNWHLLTWICSSSIVLFKHNIRTPAVMHAQRKTIRLALFRFHVTVTTAKPRHCP